MRGALALLATAGVAACLVQTPKQSLAESARATLAAWSLEDAKLRRRVQKEMRRQDLSGDEDAKGELRRLQRFFAALLDEEEYRATRIVESDGGCVRPADAPADVRGPLGDAETFWAGVVEEPADALARARRAVGDGVAGARREWDRIASSETVRRRRADALGFLERPLDAPPSLLGEVEGFFDGLWREEKARLRTGGRFVDVPARDRGPLAGLERRLENLVDVVRDYEERRVAVLRACRPMDVAPASPAGRSEALLAGLARGPLLLRATVLRIFELFDAAVLPNEYDPALDDDGAFEEALRRRRP